VCRSFAGRCPRDQGPPAVLGASRLFVLLVAARRWVLAGNRTLPTIAHSGQPRSTSPPSSKSNASASCGVRRSRPSISATPSLDAASEGRELDDALFLGRYPVGIARFPDVISLPLMAAHVTDKVRT
jgi:hypothetical protein